MEKDRLKYNINRFDHYYDSVNNKSAVYIAINSLIIGGITTGYISIDKCSIEYLKVINVFISLILFLALISVLFLIYSSIPYLSKKTNSSLFYFKNIATKSKNEFAKDSKSYSEKDELKDLRNQVHDLSIGLISKFKKLKLSGYLLVLQVLFLIPIIVIFLINKF